MIFQEVRTKMLTWLISYYILDLVPNKKERIYMSLKFRILIATTSLVFMYGCVDYSEHIKLGKSEVRNFELLKVNPPKHFYVDIKDLETGEIKVKVYVSKHCNSWRETAIVGRVYQIVVETYRDDRDGTQRIKYKDLYNAFCRPS